jgi:DNA-binding SARP family transcriptional activator
MTLALIATPPATAFHLQLHGYPGLLVQGRRVPLRLKHAFALLAVLSRARGPLGRAQLASLLWAEGSDAILRARLRRLTHQTHQLAQTRLFEGDVHSLTLREGWSSDLQRTRSAMSRLSTALDGPDIIARCIELGLHSTCGGQAAAPMRAQPVADAGAIARGAPGLAGGDAATLAALAQPLLMPEAAGVLEGFTLGTEDFDAWLDEERRCHVAALTRVLERLAARALDLDATDLAEQAAIALLQLDSCNETAHRSRLAARAARGDAAGVETTYFECARALREELGLAPSPGLEAAYARAQQTLSRIARDAVEPGAHGASQPPQQRLAA